MILYQFPISHYCEKARWALDYKGLTYRPKNLLPGFHAAKMKKMAGRTSVPVLDHDGHIVQGSSDVITYLDETFPEKGLTPVDADEKAAALDWEQLADQELGPHVRRYCYHYLLERPDLVIPLLATGGPWYAPLMLKVLFPKLRAKMRHLMKINDETAQVSLDKIEAALEKINAGRQPNGFLVGNQFSRADLAAAAMLAPFCAPDGYGVEWSDDLPEGLAATTGRLSDSLSWVHDLYREYR